MVCDLREIERRYALAEAVYLETTLRGASQLPRELCFERGIVAVLPSNFRRPQLVVLRSEQGGWWFVGVKGWRDRDERQPWTWPFLLGFAGIERIEDVEQQIDGFGSSELR